MDATLFERIRGGATVVTATNRLARHLTEQFEDLMMAAGELAWPTPAILPLSGWLRKLYSEAWKAEPVAPEILVQSVWEECVRRDTAKTDYELMSVTGCADLARAAYKLVVGYSIPVTSGRYVEPETAAFARWHGCALDRMREMGFVDPANLPDLVAGLVVEGEIVTPKDVLMSGFDEHTPQLKKLIRSLRATGSMIDEIVVPAPNSQASAAYFGSMREEVVAGAQWAHDKLRAGAKRIGIIVSRMEDYRELIEAEFLRELSPETFLGDEPQEARPFDISMGKPLSTVPIVRTGLQLASLGGGSADWTVWSELLRSPFWGGNESIFARTAFEADLIGRAKGRIGFERVIGGARSAGLRELAERLHGVMETIRNFSGSGMPSEWSQYYHDLLAAGGMEDVQGLTSYEYQARERFTGIVAGLGVLDNLGRRFSRAEMGEVLRQRCADLFLPETPYRVPVLILGFLEAAGQSFDYVWVFGCDAGRLPSTAPDNPFIPMELQRRYGVRQADPLEQHERAVRIRERILGSAVESVWSWSKREEEDVGVVSPLIEGFDRIEFAGAEAADLLALGGTTRCTLERVEEVCVPVGEGEKLRGGVKLMGDQAECPFRAFVSHRLKAKKLEEGHPGIDPLEQGSGVHVALEALAEKAPSSDALRELGDKGLKKVLAECAQAGVSEIEKRRKSALPAPLRELEARFMENLLEGWVRSEEGLNFRVIATELPGSVDLAGLELKLRTDRVDEREGIGEVVIDFKTGSKQRIKDLYDERLSEPQLPLYALMNPNARAVCYGFVARDRVGLEGVGERTWGQKRVQQPKGEYGSWEELLAGWETKLKSIGSEILEGRIDVDPKNSKSCEYCEVKPVCRISAASTKEDSNGG